MGRISLVTGAARGLGLEFCRQLLRAGDTVIACPRRPGAEALEKLQQGHAERLHLLPMDVADAAAVERAARDVGDRVERIDLLINNAGIYPDDGPVSAGPDVEAIVEAVRVNAIAPLVVAHAFLPLLRRGTERRLIQITSLMGSIEDNGSGGSYAYRMSKAALNMAVRNLAHELAGEGFTVVALHPGWVGTRMGGPGAPLDVEPAVEELLRTALGATRGDSGAFLGPGNRRLPW